MHSEGGCDGFGSPEAASTSAPPAARSSIELIGIRTAALRAGIEHIDKRYRSARGRASALSSSLAARSPPTSS
jgi:hypothetical protein